MFYYITTILHIYSTLSAMIYQILEIIYYLLFYYNEICHLKQQNKQYAYITAEQ